MDNKPMKKLILPTLRTVVTGLIAFGILLFLPAWTLNYWQAWVFVVVFTISSNAIGLYLSLKDPALLERRKKVGPTEETSPAQKIMLLLILIGVVAMLVFPAVDHRFGWSPVPAVVSLAGDLLIVISFVMYYIVFKENSFGGSTIEVVEDQKVITTGPYALVRHPMYSSVLVMVIGIPLALDSWLGLLVVALMIPALIWRILDEENLLKKDLPGYNEYMQKVRYRLVPHLW
jgi:protein-S-isoprenylcysteine O-methyltransferase Ste14